MSASDDNPYAPPAVVAVEPVPSAGSRILAFAAAVETAALIAFSVFLIQSTPGDRNIGLAYLASACVMTGQVISVYRSSRIGTWFGAASVAIHVTIMVTLLSIHGPARVRVIWVSLTIILPLLVMTLWSWGLSRRATR